MLNALFTVMALLFITAMVLQIFMIQAFFERLKTAHNALYEEMGKPRWKIQLADEGFRDGLKYIRSKQFRVLNDSELEGLYKKFKRTDYAAIGFAIMAAAIVLYQAVELS